MKILRNHFRAIVLGVGRRCRNNLTHVVAGIAIKNGETHGTDVFDGMPHQLRYLVVGGVFASVVSDFPIKRNVVSNVASHIDRATDIGVIVFAGHVGTENPLLAGLFQVTRKQIWQKIVERLRARTGAWSNRHVADFLQHVVQKEVVLAGFVVEAGCNLHPHFRWFAVFFFTAEGEKAHNIARSKF